MVDEINEINKFIVASDNPKILKFTFLQDFLLFSNSCNNSLAETF